MILFGGMGDFLEIRAKKNLIYHEKDVFSKIETKNHLILSPEAGIGQDLQK